MIFVIFQGKPSYYPFKLKKDTQIFQCVLIGNAFPLAKMQANPLQTPTSPLQIYL
jgi:hypothetical protein